MNATEIRAGVVGLGFMGQTHLRAYRDLAHKGLPVRVAAVCDADPARLAQPSAIAGNLGGSDGSPLFDPSATRAYTDLDSLLGDDEVDLVSICTHTATHVDFAIRVLEAGKHCIIEKPVALSLAEVQRLLPVAEDAQAHGVLCMPAMCMRFWPAWAWLKDAIDSGRFGPARSAVFTRLGSTPTWADSFYTDPARCGGAILDLHIHDTDFIHFCFGEPAQVVSAGSYAHITTLYRLANGPAHVAAEGCWDRHPGAPFRMRYRVDFDHASAEFELGATPELVLYSSRGASPVDLPPETGWELQIRAMIDALLAGHPSPPVTVAQAAAVMRTIEAERASIAAGAPVVPAAR